MNTLNYRQSYNKKIGLYTLVFFALHLPIFALVAYLYQTEMSIALGLSSGLLVLGALTYFKFPTERFSLCMLSVLAICYSAILIHLGRGQIEYHFHIFIVLGILPIFGYLSPLVLAAATAAIHHLGFFFVLPKSVFNYDATIYTVVIHAIFVIVETAMCLVIAYRFRNLIIMQSTTLPKLNDWSHNLTSSTTELSMTSASLSESTSSQASALVETSTAMKQISTAVDSNLKNAQNSSTVAVEVQQKSVETQQAFKLLEECMQEIIKSNERLDKLVLAMSEIGEKTKLIDNIVFKTQLLSFNASIEAERAGEHGRGFSVVADEVGSLAKVSGESANAISKIVKSAITEAKEVVSNSKKLALIGAEKCSESNSKMSEVVASSEKILQLTKEIAGACEEQSLGLKQISLSLDSINDVTKTNLHIVESSNKATEFLSEQATQMKLTVENIYAA